MSNLSELNNEDAKGILKHLISMFKKCDLSDVHEIVSSKLKQDKLMAFEGKEIDMVEYLKSYIYTSIKVLHGRSSEHYDDVINHEQYGEYLNRNLDAGPDGRKYLNPLISEMPKYLKEGGHFLTLHSNFADIETIKNKLQKLGF